MTLLGCFFYSFPITSDSVHPSDPIHVDMDQGEDADFDVPSSLIPQAAISVFGSRNA
jgi:hypothetical protein